MAGYYKTCCVRGLAMLMAAASLVMVGCGEKTYCRYNISVSLDEGLQDAATKRWPSVEVDIIGVNESEQANYSRYSMTEYFKPGNTFRSDGDTQTFRFDTSSPEAKTLNQSGGPWCARSGGHGKPAWRPPRRRGCQRPAPVGAPA
jgi:hypothetical protein